MRSSETQGAGEITAPDAGAAASHAGEDPADFRVTSALAAALGYGGTLENSEDADSFVAFAAETLAKASLEESQRVFKSISKMLDENGRLGETADRLRFAVESRNVSELLEVLAQYTQCALAKAGKTGGSGAGAVSCILRPQSGSGGDTSGRNSARAADAGVHGQAVVGTSGKVFEYTAVRERTEHALRVATWSPRADEVVRRFFSE
jgi:hypothetical protein